MGKLIGQKVAKVKGTLGTTTKTPILMGDVATAGSGDIREPIADLDPKEMLERRTVWKSMGERPRQKWALAQRRSRQERVVWKELWQGKTRKRIEPGGHGLEWLY